MKKKRLKQVTALLIFPIFFFLFETHTAHAAGLLEDGMKSLLYAVFVFVSWFTSAATTLFAYAVDSQYLSGPTGLLNLQATYDMWKFVRDIINVFFILALLFIAFAFIFQLDGYSDKKVILKLIYAALLVNFSFPIARIIIDFANVPMYFFVQMILGDGQNASQVLSSSLSASNLESIILPAKDSSDISRLLAAIVFLFIFNITLLVLAFQFLIRVVALVVLVILSPIGFVSSGIPGMKTYGKKWWDNFINYVIFGPIAMFMLVVATNLFGAISGPTQADQLTQTASSTSQEPSFIAAMVLFSIPIVILWMVIGMAKSYSIAGAAIATGYGQGFAKWTKKKGVSMGRGAGRAAVSPVTTRARSFGQGVKKRTYEGKLFGDNKASKLVSGKYWKERGENVEAKYKSYGAKFDKSGVDGEMQKLQRKRIYELAEENKKNNVSHDALVKDLDGGDIIKKKAAALTLANKDEIQNSGEFKKGLNALADDSELKNQFVKKGTKSLQSVDDLSDAIKALGADSKSAGQLLKDVNVGALPKDAAGYSQLLASEAFTTNPGLEKQLNSLLKKEGDVQILVDYKVSKGATHQDAYMDLVADMRPEDLAKQGDSLHSNAEFVQFVFDNSDPGQVFNETHRKEIFGELSGKKKAAWVNNGINP